MVKRIDDNEVAYYYDSHPTREDLMGETAVHDLLVDYLKDVLRWHFRGQRCAVYSNLNFYQTPDQYEYPIAPGVAVIKGVDFQLVSSWRVGKTGPAPQVVFEIASGETWKKDLEEKPALYAAMGVEEYFAYDPNEPSLVRSRMRRLHGWRLDRTSGLMRKLPTNAERSLWSLHLESMLVPEGKYLRLYDNQGQLRLTEAEAERRQAEIERRQADAERKQAEIERKRAEAERKRAETERRRAEALAEKLRSLGIDPDLL